jgi:hypothetical protein
VEGRLGGREGEGGREGVREKGFKFEDRWAHGGRIRSRAEGLGCIGFRISGFGFRVSGFGFRVTLNPEPETLNP